MDTKKDTRSTGLDFASDGNFHWAGATYRSLGGTDSYNPLVPVLSDTRREQDFVVCLARGRRTCFARACETRTWP